MNPRAALLLRVSASRLPIGGHAHPYRTPLPELLAAVLDLYHAFGAAYPAVRRSVVIWLHQYRRHAAPTMRERIGCDQ